MASASSAVDMPGRRRPSAVVRLDEAEAAGSLFYPSTPRWASTPPTHLGSSMGTSFGGAAAGGARAAVSRRSSVADDDESGETDAVGALPVPRSHSDSSAAGAGDFSPRRRLARAHWQTMPALQIPTSLAGSHRQALAGAGHHVGSYSSNTGRYGRASVASLGKTYSYLRQMQARALSDEMEPTPREMTQTGYSPSAPQRRSVISGWEGGGPAPPGAGINDGYGGDELLALLGDKPSPRGHSRCSSCFGRCGGAGVVKAILFGIINGVVVLPVMVGFAHTIFRDPFFTPYIGTLTKLVLFSSAVHQTGFSVTSSLPFAIGQVQDAGLIFLSAMATTIVASCRHRGATDEETLATVLCWLAISTAMLGVALIVTGWLRLAALVQYLPLPVIGGYLAFIGFYCFEAGLALMTGKEITGVMTWGSVMNHDSGILLAPGIACGVGLLLFVQRVSHPAALPCALVAIPAVFYVVLAAGGFSLNEARSAYGEGWLDPNEKQAAFWQAWDNYRFNLVHWSVLPAQLPTWLAMYFVVAFSSSLDVAAIQMELGRNLDFNHELKTVGICNLLSGISGGFTGSYIFSQTIFTMRSGTQSRATGITLIAFGLTSFVMPVSILAYVPKFFFGAVLTFIALDLMIEYLLHSRRIVVMSEFIIIWATFAAIVATNNLEIGFGIGIALCVLHFMFLYATSNAVKRYPAASTVIRGFRQRRLLAHHRSSIAVHGLQGYIFFGSALAILREVKRSIFIEDIHIEDAHDVDGVVVTAPTTSPSNQRKNFVRLPKNLVSLEREQGAPGVEKHSTILPTRFVVLDFENVSGVDATAVRSLFVSLAQTVTMHGIMLVTTSLPNGTEQLLRGNGVLETFSDNFKTFKTLDLGLQYCEDELLGQIEPDLHPTRLTAENVDIAGILKAFLFESMTFPSPGTALGEAKKHLPRYFSHLKVREGSPLWVEGSPSDAVYFVSSGSFLLYRDRPPTDSARQRRRSWLPWGGNGGQRVPPARLRVAQYGQGGLIGELDFFAHQPRSFCAVPLEDSEVYELSREGLTRMYKEQPALASLLQHVMLNSLSLSAAQTRLLSASLA